MFGKVMHARLFPKKNKFRYGIYYFNLPLSELNTLPIAYNRFGLMSFHDQDHGACDGSSLEEWARALLKDYDLAQVCDGAISLVTMPRILGYVFNPVSFWLCRDRNQQIRAVICEVHNTFGERHSYLCAHEDHRPITGRDILYGEKLFHVSPFMIRDGDYQFRFDLTGDRFGVWIDYFTPDGKKQLVTSLTGEAEAMTKQGLRRAFWGYPLVTIKAIALIHWQALKLVIKGIKYIPRPAQREIKISATRNITKM
ncbi:MAG: DUF1365 domain-containing protein [Micavibrio sp.]|nr:DUF1365 domain-containing protein [Micavibrio sp.]